MYLYFRNLIVLRHLNSANSHQASYKFSASRLTSRRGCSKVVSPSLPCNRCHNKQQPLIISSKISIFVIFRRNKHSR